MTKWREFLYYITGSAMVAGWFIIMFFFSIVIFKAIGF